MRTPPSSTPAAAPKPPTAPQTPSARLRSRPSANVTERIESAAGEMIAAPRPWNARAAISDVSDHASPASSEATVNATRPTRNSAPPPEHVREPPAEQQEAAEDEGVRADDPLQALLREPEIDLDRRQRDVHDRDVQDDHELDGAEQPQREPLLVCVSKPPWLSSASPLAVDSLRDYSIYLQKASRYFSSASKRARLVRGEALRPVLPDRARARARRRALVAARRPRAAARPAALHRPGGEPAGDRHEHPRLAAQGSRGLRPRSRSAGCRRPPRRRSTS